MAPSNGNHDVVSPQEDTSSAESVPAAPPVVVEPKRVADVKTERPSPGPPLPPTPSAAPPTPASDSHPGTPPATAPPESSSVPTELKSVPPASSPVPSTALVVSPGDPLAFEKVEEPHPDAFEKAARVAPPWLVSTVFHMVLIVLLGLWLFAPRPAKVIELIAEQIVADELGEQLEEDEVVLELDESENVEQEVALSELPEVEDPFAAPPQLEVDPLVDVGLSSDIKAPTFGMALSGRNEGMKETLLGAFGGTKLTEDAVRLGLAWLAKQQLGNGSWSLTGPYADGSHVENHAAATAMAMLAFQGSGHTHQNGSYKETVAKGLKFLLSLEEDGFFAQEATHNHRLYTQAQCTIALCELYAMTKDPALKEPAERAIAYCVEAQDPNRGGWRYSPRDDSDTSVTGWFVMALQSAKMGDLDVPQATLEKISRYLDRAGKERGSRYAYTIGAMPTISMTAEGLLCRQYLGWERDDERLQRGVEAILEPENLPDWQNRNVYFWYYATQVCHHMGGQEWDTWNDVTSKLLPKEQEKEEPERGSWHPTAPTPDRWGFQGGRLYVTCLSIYILEVYYRHLPLYSDIKR